MTGLMAFFGRRENAALEVELLEVDQSIGMRPRGVDGGHVQGTFKRSKEQK
jgi:hypothetical protein